MGRLLTSYEEAVEYLFARTTGGVRFGLERTLALLDALGRPHERLRVIHVAGTNGKGSSVATMDALLRARGLRVGRYTSPHLVDFRERIVVDGRMIPAEEVAAFVARHGALLERLGATFFEVTTALALDHFARASVDVALVETGLGGRLDSTNVVDPLVAGVVSVGIDHTDFLGESVDAIAAEKAGIFKAGRPAVLGPIAEPARGVLLARAATVAASPILEVGRDCRVGTPEVTARGTRFDLTLGGERATLTTPLLGRHQAENTAFALLLLDAAGERYRVSPAEAAGSLGSVALPGRFQRIGRHLFDVAHNVDGARVLAETLRLAMPDEPITLVLSVLGDKDWRGMLRALAPVAARTLLTVAPSAPAARAWSLAEVEREARAIGMFAEVEPVLARALDRAAAYEGTVLVTGSFHTVGDAMASLQVAPLPG